MSDWELGLAGAERRMSACDCEIEQTEDEISQEARSAFGMLARRFVAVKRRWAVSYAYLPAQRQHVHDGGMGRDELQALLRDGSVLSFHMPREGASYEDVDVVFALDSYKEDLISRDGPRGWCWAVSFVLEEV